MLKIKKNSMFIMYFHGNGQLVKRCLSIYFVTLVFMDCLYDTSTNCIKYGTSKKSHSPL